MISDTSPGSPDNIRLLITGPGGYQSGITTERPNELIFWYPQVIARAVADAPQKNNILILGGGAYTIPRHLAGQYPDSKIDVVEIDPKLADISAEHFYYAKPANVNHISSDARTYINTTEEKYDIIIVDVYSDASVPFTILTREYGVGIRGVALPDAVILANIIADDSPSSSCQSFFKASLTPYADNFKNGSYLKQHDGVANIIAMFTDMDDFSLLGYTPVSSLESQPRYTDDFAPAERLQFNCRWFRFKKIKNALLDE